MSLAGDLQSFLTHVLTPAEAEDIKISTILDTNAQLTSLYDELVVLAGKITSGGGNSIAYIATQIFLLLGGEATGDKLKDWLAAIQTSIEGPSIRRQAVCPVPLADIPTLYDDSDAHYVGPLIVGHDYQVTLVNAAVSEGGAISNMTMAWYGCQGDSFTFLSGRSGLLQPYVPVLVSPRTDYDYLYFKRHVDTPYPYRVVCCRADAPE